jgi:hypothetical protein
MRERATYPVPAEVPRASKQHERARRHLREFAQWLDHQKPEALAAAAADVPGTINAYVRIEGFFRRYRAALACRRVSG